MQTLTLDTLLSERRFQLSTHIRPAPVATIPRPMHLKENSRELLGQSHAVAATECLPRDVSSRFGVRLRELRRERNLTQLRMANDFGIDRSFISDVERGRKSISLPMLEVIALGMKLTLSDLLRDI